MWDVVLPGLFAGVVAVLVTVLIEHLGGRAGGVLGTLPSTIVPAAAGLHLSSPTTASFADAMFAVPAGMLLNALFLLLWRVLPPRLPQATLPLRLTIMVTLSVGAWLFASLGLIGARPLLLGHLGGPAFGALAAASLLALGLFACLRLPPAPRGTRHVGPLMLLLRGTCAALAVSFAVWLGAHGSGFVAGLAAVFPAIFLTTMVSLWISQGEAVPVGAVGPMMLGSSTIAAFALAAVYAVPALGLTAGLTLAWVGSAAVVAAPAWVLVTRRA